MASLDLLSEAIRISQPVGRFDGARLQVAAKASACIGNLQLYSAQVLRRADR